MRRLSHWAAKYLFISLIFVGAKLYAAHPLPNPVIHSLCQIPLTLLVKANYSWLPEHVKDAELILGLLKHSPEFKEAILKFISTSFKGAFFVEPPDPSADESDIHLKFVEKLLSVRSTKLWPAMRMKIDLMLKDVFAAYSEIIFEDSRGKQLIRNNDGSFSRPKVLHQAYRRAFVLFKRVDFARELEVLQNPQVEAQVSKPLIPLERLSKVSSAF